MESMDTFKTVSISSDAINKIEKVSDGASKISDNLTSLRGSLQSLRPVGKRKYPTVAAIKEMVAVRNAIGQELATIGEINVQPKLEKLGRSLGLGQEGEFTIKKNNVNVNIKLSIKMKASDLAQTILDTGEIQASIPGR